MDIGKETTRSQEPLSALDESISHALAVVDKGLGTLASRELVSANEVADLLLDVRTLLAPPKKAEEAVPDDTLQMATIDS